jgi:hypothetical protein
LFSLFRKIDNTADNAGYLQHLIAIRNKQKFLQTTMMNLYFVLLSAGIGLYMYECTSRMSAWSCILAWSVTIAWIAFNWFYIRPRTIKKQQAKTNDLIAKSEAVNRQFLL